MMESTPAVAYQTTTPERTPSVVLHNVAKRYGTVTILHDINLTIARSEFVVIVGPSGCGKSTLLKLIAGLERMNSGEIMIAGRDVTRMEPGDRGVAMVFQSYALYPHMTVAENMGFGLRMAKRPKAEIDAAVSRAAGILRITDQLEKRPRQLSGGQRQRVAIGRAITRSPEVFLFDEPLSNLDAALRTQMRVELSNLHARLGSTMIYVTHDQIEAMTMANRIVVLNAGRIEQVGSPLELYNNPINRFVAGFMGAPRMNFFGATIREVGAGAVSVEIAGGHRVELPVKNSATLATGKALTIGVRPEHLRLRTAAAPGPELAFPAQVRLIEYLGRETILYADASPLETVGSDTGTGNFTIQVEDGSRFHQGMKIDITFDPQLAYVFAEDGTTVTPPRVYGDGALPAQYQQGREIR